MNRQEVDLAMQSPFLRCIVYLLIKNRSYMKNFILVLFSILYTGALVIAQGDSNLSNDTPITSIGFHSDVFEWGELVEGEKIQNVFVFTNTGDHPLVLTNAKGSCGCTVPRWPKEPIMPGESADLLVQFDSKNKKGTQSKRVTIMANTDPAHTYLTIKGKIIEADEAVVVERSDDFDVESSSLTIYPNPTQGIVNVNVDNHDGKAAQIDVYDNMGKVVESLKIAELGQDDLRFDFSGRVPGLYTMAVKIEGKNRIAKQFKLIE